MQHMFSTQMKCMLERFTRLHRSLLALILQPHISIHLTFLATFRKSGECFLVTDLSLKPYRPYAWERPANTAVHCMNHWELYIYNLHKQILQRNYEMKMSHTKPIVDFTSHI